MSSASLSFSTTTSILSGLDEDVTSSKSLEVLNTMMKILSCLGTLSSSQIERAYKMAAKDKKCQLPDNQRYYLFKQLTQLRSITKVLFLQESQDSSLKSPIALVEDQNGKLILSRWSVDLDDRKDTQILMQFMSREKAKDAQILCLDQEQICKFEDKKSLNTSLAQSPKAPSIQNINFSQLHFQPLQTNTLFLTESLKLNESSRNFVGSTQPSVSSLRGHNQISWGESSLKNSHYQMKSQKKDDRQEDIQKVLARLGNAELHSKGLIEDYGEILYKDLFIELISNPDDETNQRWIEMFRDPFSNKWNHYCLQALKGYFRKYE